MRSGADVQVCYRGAGCRRFVAPLQAVSYRMLPSLPHFMAHNGSEYLVSVCSTMSIGLGYEEDYGRVLLTRENSWGGRISDFTSNLSNLSSGVDNKSILRLT